MFFERKQDVCLFPHYHLESISKWQRAREITSGNKSEGGGETDGKSSTKYTNHVVMTSSTVITHIALNSKGNIPLKILVQI